MSKYFKEIEKNMDVDFLAKLDEAREYANIPFIINSAYRSPEHNAKVGGKPGSSHIKGLAVDISAKDSRTRFLILDALFAVGFTRIGIADSFIHVDSDIDKSQNVIWTY
jgi:zinc D-Ala-D-Ala carboxypeptidase|tara:strand:- start:330 stop:656 length:327 start_codon:yes stop_codon:yes gene_type:complete